MKAADISALNRILTIDELSSLGDSELADQLYSEHALTLPHYRLAIEILIDERNKTV